MMTTAKAVPESQSATSTGTPHEVTYLEAVSQALDEEITRDERVFLMGEDIGPYGGALRLTEGVPHNEGEVAGSGTATVQNDGRCGGYSAGSDGGRAPSEQ